MEGHHYLDVFGEESKVHDHFKVPVQLSFATGKHQFLGVPVILAILPV